MGLQWVARTTNTLRELQGLETNLLNDLSARGLIVSLDDLETLAALDPCEAVNEWVQQPDMEMMAH